MAHKDFWEGIENYDSQVFSVFADKDAENPIFDYLKGKPKDWIVADLGCGNGNFLPFLSKQFKKVIAIDYSSSLSQKAKEKNSQLTNVEYKLNDMKNLNFLYNSLDIAITVNSVLPETVSEVEQIISEIYNTIKLGGEFVGIIPAADALVHLALLEHQELLDRGFKEKIATRKIKKVYEKIRQFDILGFQRDSKKEPHQKYFFPFEIEWRLKKVGFELITLQKVYYSWEYCRERHFGYFPGHERIWDWFVVAIK